MGEKLQRVIYIRVIDYWWHMQHPGSVKIYILKVALAVDGEKACRLDIVTKKFSIRFSSIYRNWEWKSNRVPCMVITTNANILASKDPRHH